MPRAEIEAEGYDLSLSRYKEDVFEEVEYEAPGVILERLLMGELGEEFFNHDTRRARRVLAKVQSGIVRELLELRGMIG